MIFPMIMPSTSRGRYGASRCPYCKKVLPEEEYSCGFLSIVLAITLMMFLLYLVVTFLVFCVDWDGTLVDLFLAQWQHIKNTLHRIY